MVKDKSMGKKESTKASTSIYPRVTNPRTKTTKHSKENGVNFHDLEIKSQNQKSKLQVETVKIIKINNLRYFFFKEHHTE